MPAENNRGRPGGHLRRIARALARLPATSRNPTARRATLTAAARPLRFFFRFTNHMTADSTETDEEPCPLDSRRVDQLPRTAEVLRIAHSTNRRLSMNLYYNRCCRFSTFFLLFFCCSNLNPTLTGNRYNVECAQVKHGSSSA